MIKDIMIIKGKNAKRFYKNINDGKISEEQKKFLEECKELLHEYEEGMWLNLKKPHKNRGENMEKYKEKEHPKNLKHEGKTYEISYIQEPKWGPRGELTVAHITVEGVPVIEVSERSPSEDWSENQGKLVAGGRLIKKLVKIQKCKGKRFPIRKPKKK